MQAVEVQNFLLHILFFCELNMFEIDNPNGQWEGLHHILLWKKYEVEKYKDLKVLCGKEEFFWVPCSTMCNNVWKNLTWVNKLFFTKDKNYFLTIWKEIILLASIENLTFITSVLAKFFGVARSARSRRLKFKTLYLFHWMSDLEKNCTPIEVLVMLIYNRDFKKECYKLTW